MLIDFIISSIIQELPFQPNSEQKELVEKIAAFILSREEKRVFLLRGYAGTGKTSIMAALVKALNRLQQKTVLLAPTGRAAKVLAQHAGKSAYTIHKYIYRQKQIGKDSFSLSFNTQHDTIFIVDEASMIANQSVDNSSFGSGRLLDDLLKYVFLSERCSLILIGDDAQLPPVGQAVSPALHEDYLRGYGLKITTHTLTIVARQALESGILSNATYLRDCIRSEQTNIYPQIKNEHFSDIKFLSGNSLIEELERSYSQVGQEETIIITRSNRAMNMYNQGVRTQIMWKEDELSSGDRVMVTKNNYYATRLYEGIDFLANGDMFEVQRVRHPHQLYGFNFADVSLKAIDYDWEIDTIALINSLYSETPEAGYLLTKQLFENISKDYPQIKNQKELTKQVLENPYYNALHIKHAYAVTCHKAQGGQWKNVFIDQGKITEDMLSTDYYRWLYTALTRATEKVFLVNFSPNK